MPPLWAFKPPWETFWPTVLGVGFMAFVFLLAFLVVVTDADLWDRPDDSC